MNPRDKNSSQQPEGNKRNLKGYIYLIVGIVILTAMGTSAITIVVLKRLGLISGLPIPSPSPTVSSISPSPSPSPTVSPTLPIPSTSPTVSSISRSPSPSPQVLYTATQCLSDTPGISLNQILHSPNNSTITIGKEFVSEIANISNYYGYQEITSQPLEFICSLNSSYKQLRLVFGVNDVNPLSQPSNKIQFEILLDNKSAATQQVTVGPKQTLDLDVQGIKTVALRVACTSTCPPLSFTEMELK